ncbi:MAG: hypothetical protein Alis3KO_25670 [Aliiglaciecola sp.]
MSSHIDSLPEASQAIKGDESNTVSIHSKRELKPWWKLEFDQPQYVEFIEFYNRKDKWGVRSKTLYLEASDTENKVVAKAGRVTLTTITQAFCVDAISLLLMCESYMSHDKQLAAEFQQFLVLLFDYLADSEVDPSKKHNLIETSTKLNWKIAEPTPDLGANQKQSNAIQLPEQSQYLRIIGYRRKLPRPVSVFVKYAGKIVQLNEQDKSNFIDQHFELKKTIWSLQHPHIFELKDKDLSQSDTLEMWVSDYYSGDAFVQRMVQTSEDGENWITVESTLPNLAARLALLSVQEWLQGQQWNASFVEQLGHFLATYRMSQARTIKPLMRDNRSLLPILYRAVDEGGKSASFIPPVRYTRHGLTVPFEFHNSNFLAQRMQGFCQFLKKTFNLDAFPCYGTLLGLYRDGDFLPHDDDIDLAVIVDLPAGLTYRQATEAWAEELKKHGVMCRPPTPKSLNLHCYYDDFDMDLFFIYRMQEPEDCVWTHMEGYQVRKVKRDLFEPLTHFEFFGMQFNVPHQIENFLEDRYGKGWVTPDPTFEL